MSKSILMTLCFRCFQFKEGMDFYYITSVVFLSLSKRYEMRSKMFSGPIMPRITECLAQRQEVAPEEVEEVTFRQILDGKLTVQPKG